MPAIEPKYHHLLVVKLKGPDQIGSIVVPEAHVEDASYGEIVSIGEDVRGLAVGDVVYFQRYAGFALKEGEHEYILLPQVDVLGVKRDPSL
jgi:co-chaperonin GroES (HSP10)